jgi:hypothetical protein
MEVSGWGSGGVTEHAEKEAAARAAKDRRVERSIRAK